MKKALIVALALSLIGLTAWGALDKADYRGGVFWTDRHNAVLAGITSTGYFEPLLGINFLDDIDLSFGGSGGGTAGPLTIEWTTADADANCFLIDLPTGGSVDVPVMILASSDSNFGYFNGIVEPTLAVENLVGTSWIALDHSATTLARLQAGGAATYLTIQTELAGSDIVLDAADAAANTAQQYVSITGTIPAHASGTPTDIFLDITPTIGINTATATVHLVDLSFTTPVWGSGAATSTVSGVYLAPTIGAATAGTNTVNMIEIANYTGDAQVNVTGISIGTSDGLGTANAISINTGWTAGIDCNSPVTLSHADADLDVEDEITCGNLNIDEASGVISFTGATDGRITTSNAAAEIVLDAADQTTGVDKTYVQIEGTVPIHDAATPTSIFLDINPTVGIPTVANTVNLIDMVFTVPDYATGVASTYRGIYFDPTLSNASAGTNNLALIDVAAMDDGDDEQNVYVLRVGALTNAGTGTENVIDIGSGWDLAINTASPITLTGTAGDIDAHDNITAGDIIIDEAAGVLDFSGATSATISTSTGTCDIVLDSADDTAGSDKTYVSITGSVPAHLTNTPTSVFLDITPTVGIPTVDNTVNLVDLTFTTPIYATAVTSTYRGLYFAPTIGDASTGTNAVALIDVAAITGDAQVSLYGLRFGILTGTAATENAVDIASGWDYGIECESKSRFGLAQGATGINMDGTDPDQAFQVHADIDSDTTGGAYAATYETMTLSNSTTNDTSIFGDWAELYVTGDLTLAKGNLAGSWGHLELVDGGGGNLTLNAVSDVYPNYAGGVVGTVIAPDTLVVGAHRSLAAVVASGAIASGYSVNADGDFAGILIRADDQPFPVGLLIDDDDATIDIQLSTDQYIDGSTAGVASVAGDSAVEYVAGCMRTVITVDSTSAGDDIDLENKDDGGGTLLYTFPVGHIRILGVVADLTATSSAGIYQATFPMSIGTTAAADAEATLTGTEADLCASTAISYDGAVACDLPPVSATDMTYDGTSSAIVAYLNAAVANANINAAATVKCTGTVTIHWMLLGDY